MPEQEYIYQDRIIAFIDVLGYREKLKEFQDTAVMKEIEGTEVLVSPKVNEFVNTFKAAIEPLDKKNIQYYLFSDNICIAADHIENQHLKIELLFSINELFYAFAQKSYFLRGAIETGKFIDERMIALGVPLSDAYLAETKKAVYPRILISKQYYDLINDYLSGPGADRYPVAIKNHLIYQSCELYYLNVFYHVFMVGDKMRYFNSMREKIMENLIANGQNESVYVKYEWLAREYNRFLDIYVSELVNTEQEEQDPQIIEQLSQLKIDHNGI